MSARRSGPGSDAPGAAPYVPERPTLDRLREAAQACRGCELHEAATQAVVGVGPVDAAMMLAGEQPGDQEDLAGRPFVGPAERLLDKALQAAGIEPEGVFVTNAVKHFRFSGTRGKRRIHASPGRVHIAACQPWLLAELDRVTPQGVVLLGATAAKSILGSSFKITEGRGQVLAWPGEFPLEHTPQWALATTHPSEVLRSTDRDAAFEALVSDLKVAGSARS